MPGDSIKVNGYHADSGSIVAKFDGVDYYGFTEISGYGEAVEEKLLYGYNKRRGPRGRTKGVKKPDKITLKGPLSTTRALARAVKAKARDGLLSTPQFPITVTFMDGDEPHTDVLRQCRILKVATALPAAESSDAVLEEIELQPMTILRDGIEGRGRELRWNPYKIWRQSSLRCRNAARRSTKSRNSPS